MVRIGELLGAMSLSTDLAAGLPLEASIRCCVLATRVSRTLGWSELGEVRRTTLLRHLGCTSFARARPSAATTRALAAYAGVVVGAAARSPGAP
jgi:hypothetical protein